MFYFALKEERKLRQFLTAMWSNMLWSFYQMQH